MKTKPDNYVKDRYICRTIRLVKDIMKITSLDNISGVTIIFDFKKPLILKIGISLIKSATGVFNFVPQRGVRQGCPLPGILFVLCAEILAQAIRNNNNDKNNNDNDNDNHKDNNNYNDNDDDNDSDNDNDSDSDNDNMKFI